MIYLDYSANTPPDPAVLERFVNTEQTFHGNPNSNHPAGLAAREELARLTGGGQVSQTMLDSAEELLSAADAFKKTLA